MLDAKTTHRGLAFAVGALSLACSSGQPPPAMVVMPDGGDASGMHGKAYALKQLGCGSAGTQSVAAVSGSTIAFASLAKTTKTQTCTIMPLGPVMKSQVDLWDVCYAASVGGGAFKSQVVTTQPYLGPTGVGLAFDSSGAPTVAFTGVGATPAMETCGANDVFVTSLQGGAFTTPQQVSQGSASNGLVADQAGNCSQNVCGQGDATGFWPAIGFDSSNNARIAYRDIHFGFAMDDFAKSDLEVAMGSGGSYQVLTTEVATGAGEYNRVAFDPTGLPAILTYEGPGMSPGVYLDRQAKAGSFSTQQAAGGWGSQQIFSGPIESHGQLGFGISPKGLYSIAYNDGSTSVLMYTESMDAKTWSTPAPVDTDGYTGLYPSLAFDADGNPAIAYYKCNAIGPMQTTCDPSSDGLYLARRSGSSWSISAVASDSTIQDGLYPALAFVNGKAFIAFQEVGYDPLSKKSTVSWWVAEEP